MTIQRQRGADRAIHVPDPHAEPARQVRVWFGQQVVIRYEGNPADAAHYEATMRRRFTAGRVTNEAVPSR